MSSLKKKIGKMISQPNNVTFETLDSVLKGIGCKDLKKKYDEIN